VGRRLARIAYYLFVVPAGVVARLVADPLNMKSAPSRTNWQAVRREEDSLERSRSQS